MTFLANDPCPCGGGQISVLLGGGRRPCCAACALALQTSMDRFLSFCAPDDDRLTVCRHSGHAPPPEAFQVGA